MPTDPSIAEAWNHVLDGYRQAFEVEGLPEIEIKALAAGLDAATKLLMSRHPGSDLPSKLEVAPGIVKPVDEMTSDEMQAADEVLYERGIIDGEIAALLAESIARSLRVPPDLLARIGEQLKDGPVGGNPLVAVTLRDELRDVCREGGDA
jgi:hypothetical protein